MEKVFVDTDIIIDLLTGREPFGKQAEILFSMADKQEIILCVSPLSFSNVNYILSKQYSAAEARKKILVFKTLVTVLPVNDKIIELALVSDFNDFEEAINYYTAIEGSIQVLLTRNLKDYKTAAIAIMTAEEYYKTKN